MVVLSLSRMARGRLVVRPANEAMGAARWTPPLPLFRNTVSTSLTAVSPSLTCAGGRSAPFGARAEAAACHKRRAMPMRG